MSIMPDCGVTTAWAVLMGVVFMCFAIAHSNAFLFHLLEPRPPERYTPKRLAQAFCEVMHGITPATSPLSFDVMQAGPGTGKTRTVVVLLALLMEQNPGFRVALAAPTGKAAARLQDAVKDAKAKLACAPPSKERLPTEASTLHRLLGSIPDSSYFRHDADNPLPWNLRWSSCRHWDFGSNSLTTLPRALSGPE